MNDLGIDIRHDAEVLLNASIRGDIDLTPNMAPEKFLDREMFLRKPYQALHDAMKAAHDSWDEVMVCFNVSLPPDIDLEKELQCWESLLHVMEIIKGQESRFKKTRFWRVIDRSRCPATLIKSGKAKAGREAGP